MMKKLLLVIGLTTIGFLMGCAKQPDQTEKEMAVQKEMTAMNYGVVRVPSNNSIDETYRKLVEAINHNDALSVIAELNHQKNAASVDMELRPTRILMFGNPKLGTPLMQSSQITGLDLPQKMLVYEDANEEVFIAYNDPVYLADRHGIEDQKNLLDKITGALKSIAEGAADK